MGTSPVLLPYLPRLVVEWAAERADERARSFEGTLVSIDLAGFTSLSERLQAKGRRGAEELIGLVSATFADLIALVHAHGGDVLKFRGDALLLLFLGEDHALRACHAAAEMQAHVAAGGRTTSSVGDVTLSMATGVFTGDCHAFLVGSSHRELVLTGPAATATYRLEDAAEAGEILVSRATAAALSPAWAVGERDGATLVSRPDAAEPPPVVVPPSGVADVALEHYVPAPLRAQLALEAGEGEHRRATVSFLKFTGTDDVLARDGAEAVLGQLDALAELVGETVDELGITWLESDIDANGGKLYLVAGAPASAGDDEERMLRALRRIIDARVGPPLRVGVNRGPVFAGDIGGGSRRTYAVMGDTVNLAARLTARAEQGQILASADVVDRSKTRFQTTHQPFLMKGKERAVMAYSVGEPLGTRADEAHGRLPLVGREDEVEALTRALDAARMRQFQLVEVVGDPGIGKSRLVEELRERAVGFQQLETRCEQYEQANAFFAVRSILRPLAGIRPDQSAAEAGAQLAPWVQAVMPDLAPWLPLLAIPFDADVEPTPEASAVEPQFRRDKLHEVVDSFLTRVLLMPTLLVVEDVHWIDDASGFLLRHLAASPLPRPWLVCLTSRPEGQRFAEGGRGTILTLPPLPPEQATALALSAADDAPIAEAQFSALLDRAGGNPLFVRELVAAARAGGDVDALPETIETLLTARIDTLPPDDRLLLRYAAVVGPVFELPFLAEIADRPFAAGDVERWRRLSEFVEREDGDRLRFRHDLFRAMAYAGLSFRRRREIHGRVADALERRAGESVDEIAGLLSLHFQQAGRFDKAWAYAVLAGGRAQAMYANVVAAELYERALEAAESLELEPARVAPVWESLGDVCELFARYDRAGEAYARALELVAGDSVAQARLLRKSGVVCERVGRYDEALERYRRGLDGVGGAADGAHERVELELATAGVRYRQGRYEDAAEWSRRAVNHAEQAGDRSALAHAYYLLDIARTRMGSPESTNLERALAIYDEAGDLVGKATVLNNLGSGAYHEYRWDEATRLYEESRELSKRAGDISSVARASLNQAEILSDRGRLREATELLTEALRVWRAAGYSIGTALASSNLGRAEARRGNFEEARRLLARAAEEFERLGNTAFLADTRMRLAELNVLEGQHREALELATRTLAEVDGAGGSAPLAAALERLVGYALVQARRKDEAAPHFERSLALAREHGARFEEALTLRAISDAGLQDDGGESARLLADLGVESVPRVPLP